MNSLGILHYLDCVSFAVYQYMQCLLVGGLHSFAYQIENNLIFDDAFSKHLKLILPAVAVAFSTISLGYACNRLAFTLSGKINSHY